MATFARPKLRKARQKKNMSALTGPVHFPRAIAVGSVDWDLFKAAVTPAER